MLAILSCLLPGPQVLVYIALWILMPDERKYSTTVPGGESPDKRS